MTGSAVLPRTRNHRTVLALLAIVSLLLSMVSPVSAQLARPQGSAAATPADHSASDFFIFSKVVYGKATQAEGFETGETPRCSSSQDLSASVQGSNNIIFDRIHSNADWNASGESNTFLDVVTYGTHDEDCANTPGSNTYSAGPPSDIDGPPEILGPHEWPGTLGASLNSDGLTFSTIEQVLGAGAVCNFGSLTGGDISITAAHDDSVICGGPSSTISLGSQGLNIDITVVSHGIIDFNASDSTLRPWKHGILAWTDKDSFQTEHPFKLQGSNFHVGPAIVFTPRAGQDISGSTGSEDCIQHIGQGQIKVQGSSSFFGTGACGGQPNLSIAKSTTTPVITAGDVASYTVTVSNTGSAEATGVTITDTLPSGLTWTENPDTVCTIAGGFNLSCGPMNIAASGSFSVTVQGTTDAGECPSISNTASYTSTNAGSGNTNANPTVITVNCPVIDIQKEPDEGDNGNDVNAGSVATFTLVTTNNGPGGATGVKLTDTLPVAQNGWAISASTWPGSPNPAACAISGAAGATQTLTCGGASGVSLAALATLSVSITTTTDGGAAPNDCGGFNNPDATASSTNAGSDIDAGEIDVLCASIDIEKEPDEGDPGNDVNAGAPASFTLRTANNGSGTATAVKLTDTLPVAQNGWTITTNWSADPAFDCEIAGAAGTAQVLTCGGASGISLLAGTFIDVVVSTVTDGVGPQTDCGGFNNPDATATSSNDGSDVDAGEIDVLCPAIDIQKEPDEGDPGNDVNAGDTATFTLRTTNTGLGTATGVKLSDILPAAQNGWTITTNWSADPAIDCEIAGAAGTAQTLTCGGATGITLLPNAFIDVAVSTLTDGVGAANDCGGFNNPNASATTANDGSDTDAGEIDVLCAVIDVEKEPDEGDPGNDINAGQSATFTLRTTNSGPGTATGVKLSDTLPIAQNGWTIGTNWTADEATDCDITGGPGVAQTLTCGGVGGITLLAGAWIDVTVSTVTDGVGTPNDCGGFNNPDATATSTNDGSDIDAGEIDVLCPDIEIDKTPDDGDLDAEVTAGDYGTFTITTSNEGQGDATGVVLFDDLLELTNQWEIVDALTTWDDCEITDDLVNIDADPDLEDVDFWLGCGPQDLDAGAELVVVVRVLTSSADCDVETDVRVVDNTAHADSANDGSDSDTGQLTILCPDIEIDKTPDDGDLDAEVTAGDYGTFTITTSNEGQGDATGVVLFDDLLELTNQWEIVDALTTWDDCEITDDLVNIDADPDLEDVDFWLGCGPQDLDAGAELVVVVRVLTSSADCDVETDVRVVDNTAHADSANDGSDSDTGQLTILCPDLHVTKAASTLELLAPDTLTYTIIATNDGEGVADEVNVSDDLDNDLSVSSATYDVNPTVAGGMGSCTVTTPANTVSCDVGDLAASDGMTNGPDTVIVAIVVEVPVEACPSVTNQASVSAANESAAAAEDNLSDVVIVDVNCPDVSVEKTATDPVISSTQQASFSITVNGGEFGTNDDVTLTDLLPAGFTWTLGGADSEACDIVSEELKCNFGSLEPDETKTITLTANTTETNCDLTITNTADVATDGDTDEENDSSTATIEVQCPDLERSKTADAPVVSAGQQIGFVIEVSNSDAEDTGIAFNVTINDPLPVGDGIDWEIADDSLDGDACSIGGVAPAAQTLVCDFDDLAPGDDVSVHVVSGTTLDSCDTYVNVATVDADNHAALTANASVTVECPGLNHAKVADPATIVAGDTATFRIVLWNTGDGTTFDVTLEDDLPGDLNWSENSDDCSIAAGVLTCDFGDLAPGSTMAAPGASVTLTALTDRTDCGVLNNTSIADADPGEPIPASASITVRCPEVEITKVNNTVASVLPGTPVGFTVTVVVTDGPADDVTVVDTLPAGYDAPTDISNGGTYNPTTRKITWSPVDLATGTYTRTYTARVSASVANGTSLVNVAVVFSPNSQCPDLESIEPECDDDSTVLVRVPTLVIDKVANTEVITISGPTTAQTASPSLVIWTLSYTLTNGPVTGAVITDVVPTGLNFVSASNGGTYNAANRTITWNLGTLTTSGSVTFQTTIDVATISRTAPTVNVATIDSNETAPDTGQDEIRVVVEPPPLASTPTPRPIPNTAVGIGLGGEPVTVPLEFLVALFVGSLGVLAFANVRAVRRRRR